ncbi:MAG: amidohydrolase family protein [Chloroflexi bacterium]|nr:amidohydrolase family protein [Chloroflexota bacterium]
MLARPKVIDFHAHYLPLKLIDAYRKVPFGRGTAWLWESPAFSDPALHVKMMDEVGVDVELLGPSAAFLGAIDAAGMESREAVRLTNDEFARVVRDYPGRFVGGVAIDPFDVQFALAEIERCVTKLNFRAISMVTSYNGLYIDDEQFWPIFKLAEELDVPIFAHPGRTTLGWKEMQRSEKSYLRAEISMLLDSTICVGRFVLFGIYDRFPTLKVVFGQLGGFVPFMFGRFDLVHNYHRLWPPEVVADEAVLPARLLRDYRGRIMGDTHSVEHIALECAAQTLGADCIVVGSDFPIGPISFSIRWNLEEIGKMRVSEGDRNKILGENAARLLKLDA